MSEYTDRVIGEPIDGIQEYDNPMPRWWLNLFYFTIAFAVVYCVMYPSFWFWGGTTGWTQTGQYDAQMQQAGEIYKSAGPESIDLAACATEPDLVAAGKEIFKLRCVPCHGENAEGKIGPSLVDDEWKFGGTSEDVVASISGGRPGGMPPWQKVLGTQGIKEVGAYVWTLSEHKQE